MVASVPMTSTRPCYTRGGEHLEQRSRQLSERHQYSQALNQEKSDQARLDPATASVRNDDQILEEMIQAWALFLPPLVRVRSGRQTARICCKYNGYAVRLDCYYPDNGVVSSEMHVPVGREVLVNISANDVIHAFWVPEFRLKQDAIPGRQSEVRFTPKIAGEYPLICAELCGPYHEQ